MAHRLRDAELQELRLRATVQEATLAMQRTELGTASRSVDTVKTTRSPN